MLDVNECINDPCGFNANCTNSVGSFLCDCQSGYEGNGTNCTGNLFLHNYSTRNNGGGRSTFWEGAHIHMFVFASRVSFENRLFFAVCVYEYVDYVNMPPPEKYRSSAAAARKQDALKK